MTTLPLLSPISSARWRSLRLVLSGLFALWFAGLSPSFAHAQQLPKIPTPKEIETMLREEIEKLPSETIETEGISIRYKKVPADPEDLIKQLPIPPGIDPQLILKQFGFMIDKILNEVLTDLGTLTLSEGVRLKRNALPVGTFQFGLAMTRLTPSAWQFQDPPDRKRKERLLRRPVRDRLRPMKTKQKIHHPTLMIRFQRSEKKPERLVLVIGWNDREFQSAKYLETPVPQG